MDLLTTHWMVLSRSICSSRLTPPFTPPLSPLPWFHWSLWCHIAWNIPLLGILQMASLGQLSWFCPLPHSCTVPAPHCQGSVRRCESPWLCTSTALQQPKQHYVINIILTLHLKDNTIPATRKKIYYIPDKTRKYCYF